MPFLRLVPDTVAIDFVRHRFIAFAVTGTLLVATIAALATVHLNLGVDFAGGTLLELRAAQPVDVGELRGRIATLELGDFEIQAYGADNGLLIRVERLPDPLNAEVPEKVRGVLGGGLEVVRVESVGPRVGGDLMRDGILATLLAVAAISLYVWFRFEWQFGIAAVIATFHDVLVTVGLYSVFQLEFNLTSIAALLALAGYSINDTIVVFDRIRENLRRSKSASLGAIINASVNQTLSRTLATSGTTLLAILPLILFGGDTLFGFSVAVGWGILVGTYSSIFVAAPLLLYLPSLDAARRAAAAAPEPDGGAAPDASPAGGRTA